MTDNRRDQYDTDNTVATPATYCPTGINAACGYANRPIDAIRRVAVMEARDHQNADRQP